MKQAIDTIYENGAFRPVRPETVTIPDGRRVRITVHDEPEPEALRLATQVYDGLSNTEIDEIEQIALDRRSFFGARSVD